jgi:membrane protein
MSLQLASIRTYIAATQRKASAFLWQQDLDLVPVWKRGLVRSSQIIVAVIRDLMQEQLSLRAMSLVFTTVIGFFPMIALTFAVLKSLGVHNAMEPTLLTLLQPLGERANEFTQQILSYVDNLQVQLIGITSVGLLIYFVLDMMRKIESAFNYIWAVKKGRSLSSRISEYLFAVIVSPLLLFLSISLTSYINTKFFESFLENLIFGSVIIEVSAFIISILLMSLAFAFAYSFLPNTKVQFSSAFIGGLVTTIIWKLMGSVFQGIFVASARESIYLAFASAIAIMFFIYIGWLVALIGSSIAFYHQNPSKTRSGRTTLTLSIAQQEQLSLAVAIAIIRRFQLGQPALTDEELARNLDSNLVAIEQALEQLQKIGLISRTGDQSPAYLPSHSIEDCTMVDIWRALRESNADHISISDDSAELLLAHQFQQDIDDAIVSNLGRRKFVDLSEEGDH